MRLQHTLAILLVCASAGGLPALGCGGAVDSGGPRGGSSSGASSSGSGSSSSSGGPVTSPQCTGLALPAIAEACADGSSASPYYVWNGSQCVLTFSCPTSPGQPVPVPPGTTYPGPVGPGPYPGPGPSAGPPPTPTPPVCNFALPNLCEACPNGETICAHYAIQNGTCVVEICPPSYVPTPAPTPVPVPPPPPGGSCSQGAYCQQGEGCGTAGSGPYSCSTTCNCDYTGHFQCSQSCPPSPGPSGCSQGAYCSPGTACGGGPDSNGCFVSCTCDSYSTLQCSYMCGFGAYDAGVD